MTHIFDPRLKGSEAVIAGLGEVKQLVEDFEQSVAQHEAMTSDLGELKAVKTDLMVGHDS